MLTLGAGADQPVLRIDANAEVRAVDVVLDDGLQAPDTGCSRVSRSPVRL